MPTIIEQLQALPLGQVDGSLTRVQAALVENPRISLDRFDPLSLLGDVGPLVTAAGQLDADSDGVTSLLREALGELGALVSLPELGDLSALVTRLGELASQLDQVVGVFASGDGTALVNRLLTERGGSVDLVRLLGDVGSRVSEAYRPDLPEPLVATFRQLSRLTVSTLSAQDVADVLLDVVVGLDLSVVASLATDLRGSVAMAATAGDTAALEAAVARVDSQIDVAVRLTATAATVDADLDLLVAALTDLDAMVADLAKVTLPRFVGGFATDLRSARNLLVEADFLPRIDDLLVRLPRAGIDALEIVLEPLRDLAGGLDAVTSVSISQALDAARAEITAFTHEGEFAALLDGIESGQRSLIRLIRSLPLDDIRDAVVSHLRTAQREILAFEGFSFLDEVLAPVRDLAVAIGSLDTTAVTGAVEDLVGSVREVFDDFPIDELRDALDGVVGPLVSLVEEIGPVLEVVISELESLMGQLDSIDFEAAGAAVVELLGEIRQKVVDALGTDAVPDAVKAVVGEAASALRAMDLRASIEAPFQIAVQGIDLDALIEPVKDLWGELGGALEKVTPQALIDQLDGPFATLLDGLDTLSLGPLIQRLAALFDQVTDAVNAFDPRTLVAPLQVEFDGIVETLRTTLDPAPLFAPLRQGFDAIKGAVDAIDAKQAIDAMLGGIADTPGSLASSIGSAMGTGGAAPVGADVELRFGDVLRPLAAFVAEIRGRLHALVDDVGGEAFGLLADATRALRSLVDPVTGFAVEIAEAVDARRGWFDAAVLGGPLADLRTRLTGLGNAVSSLDLSVSARARVDGATGGVRIEARLDLPPAATAAATDAIDRLRSTAEPGGLGRSLRLLSRGLDDLLPDALIGTAIDPRTEAVAFVDAVVDVIDPAAGVAELDAIGDRIMAKLAEFVDELSVGLVNLWDELMAGLEPVLPSSLAGRIQAVVDAIGDELSVLDPSVIETEVRDVIDATIGLLSLYSPAALADRLGAVFDAAVGVVERFDPAALFGNVDPFADLKTELEQLRPSVVLGPLTASTAELTAAVERVSSLDLGTFDTIVADLDATFTVVLTGVDREWNALLDELARSTDVSGSVSVSGGVG